jgi:UDP-2,3-diacylglucosamine pyrophosphatase LpxH
MAMTTALISDLHLGAWQLNDLLRYPIFIRRLAKALEGVDEVVLLGDVLELRFQRLEIALQVSQPFFAALGDALRARRPRNASAPRVVYVAGNHDYHFALQLMEREQEAAIERGEPDPYTFRGLVHVPDDMFLRRELRRMLGPGVEVEFAYAYHRFEAAGGLALAMHGHYLDLYLASPAERLLALVEQALTAYRLETPRPGFDIFEAVLRPQNELLYWIGQSPAGAQVQSELWRRLRGDRRHLPKGLFGRLRRIAARRALRAAEALAGAAARQLTQRVLKGDVTAISPARATSVEEGIQAFMDTLYALQEDLFAAERWTAPPAYVIFGHTHRPGPLPGVDTLDRWRAQWAGHEVQVLNTGSWLYDVERALTQEYYETHWPGTVVVFPDGAQPHVMSVLKDLTADDIDELTDTAPLNVRMPGRA